MITSHPNTDLNKNSRTVRAKEFHVVAKYAMSCIDFKTEGLFTQNKSTVVPTREILYEFFLDTSDLGYHSAMGKKRMTPAVVNNRVKYSSYDWLEIIKKLFQHTALIDHRHADTETNWCEFANKIIAMIQRAEALSTNDKEKTKKSKKTKKPHKTTETAKPHPAFLDIPGAFKRFLGQLIKDKQDDAAQAIHLMLAFAYQATDYQIKSNSDVSEVTEMLSAAIYYGLEFDAINKIKDGHVPKEINYLKEGLKILFKTPIFESSYQEAAKEVYSQDEYRQHYHSEASDPNNNASPKQSEPITFSYNNVAQLNQRKTGERKDKYTSNKENPDNDNNINIRSSSGNSSPR